jgi:hypothetical protein
MSAWAIYNPKTGEMEYVVALEDVLPGFKTGMDMSVRDWEEFAANQNELVAKAKMIIKEIKQIVPEKL